jgi:hypothetical protein
MTDNFIINTARDSLGNVSVTVTSKKTNNTTTLHGKFFMFRLVKEAIAIVEQLDDGMNEATVAEKSEFKPMGLDVFESGVVQQPAPTAEEYKRGYCIRGDVLLGYDPKFPK